MYSKLALHPAHRFPNLANRMSIDQKRTSVFIAYARENYAQQQYFLKLLSPLIESGSIQVWHEQVPLIGTEWEPQIKAAFYKADIVVVLVSVYSLSSTYFMKHEMAKVFKRRKAGQCEVIPVILGNCLGKQTPFKNIQTLPKDGKPIDTFAQNDEVFKEVAQVVEKKAEAIRNLGAALHKKLDEAIKLFNAREYKASIRLLREIQMNPLYVSMPSVFRHKVEDTLLFCEKALWDEPDPYKRFKVIGSYGALGIFWILIGMWLGPQLMEDGGKDTLAFSEDTTSVMSMLAPISERMVWVEGGTFIRGCISERKDCIEDEKSAHKVEVASFYMGATEVSFEEYDAYCDSTSKKKPNDRGWGRGRRPVINVSWYDVVEYCNWLSKLEGLDACYSIDKETKDSHNKNRNDDDVKWTVVCDFGKNGYRLPTEAEWEYAARGGDKSKCYIYAGSSIEDSLHIYGNFCDSNCDYNWQDRNQNDGYMHTSPIGIYRPNELGIYDMSGNVWEWCWDWYASDIYKDSPEIYRSPKGRIYGSLRVLRGGSWYYDAASLRVANRNDYRPYNRFDDLGFRLSRTP